MAFTLSESVGGSYQPVTTEMESFFVYQAFDVAAANCQVNPTWCIFAGLVSKPRAPKFRIPAWTSTSFKIDGPAGLGSFSLQNAAFLQLVSEEIINEYTRLIVFQLNPLTDPSGWWNEAAWNPQFVPATDQGNHDKSRFLFHRVGLGQVDDRWAHSLRSTQIGGVTNSLTVTAPFLNPSLFHTVLQSSSFDTIPRYMPPMMVKSYYGQDVRADRTWNHFHGQAANLPGAVSGFSMIAQGAFKAIGLGEELASWLMSPADLGNLAQLTARLSRLVSTYPAFRRDLESVTDCDRLSVVVPPANNLPIEVLHLTGLASPQPLF